jgi:hypothetical protein
MLIKILSKCFSKFGKIVKNMQKKLEQAAAICNNIFTSLMGLAIRPQVSSEPGLFFAQKQEGE